MLRNCTLAIDRQLAQHALAREIAKTTNLRPVVILDLQGRLLHVGFYEFTSPTHSLPAMITLTLRDDFDGGRRDARTFQRLLGRTLGGTAQFRRFLNCSESVFAKDYVAGDQASRIEQEIRRAAGEQ